MNTRFSSQACTGTYSTAFSADNSGTLPTMTTKEDTMRHPIKLICLALMLAVSSARGDIMPQPDRGSPSVSVAGLDFAVQSVAVKFPPGYTKTLQVAVLVGCVSGRANCEIARSRNLIGMEVLTVGGQYLRPENGMMQQIVNAFEHKSSNQTVTLELFSRTSNGPMIKVAFARH